MNKSLRPALVPALLAILIAFSGARPALAQVAWTGPGWDEVEMAGGDMIAGPFDTEAACWNIDPEMGDDFACFYLRGPG